MGAETLDPHQPGLRAAELFLQHRVGEKLYRGLSLALDPPAHPGDGLRFRLVPGSLLRAMWPQVAASAAGNVEHRPCKNCSALIEVRVGGGTDGRTHKAAYGGESGRQKYYHRMKREAVARARSGTPVEVIARDPGRTEARVWGWVKAAGVA